MVWEAENWWSYIKGQIGGFVLHKLCQLRVQTLQFLLDKDTTQSILADTCIPKARKLNFII